jgi:excisionase family DNA binding protein
VEKRLLNIKEVSEYLGVKEHTLYTWVSQRRIPFVKCGRLTKFDIRAIDKWIDGNTVNGVDLSKYRT